MLYINNLLLPKVYEDILKWEESDTCIISLGVLFMKIIEIPDTVLLMNQDSLNDIKKNNERTSVNDLISKLFLFLSGINLRSVFQRLFWEVGSSHFFLRPGCQHGPRTPHTHETSLNFPDYTGFWRFLFTMWTNSNLIMTLLRMNLNSLITHSANSKEAL